MGRPFDITARRNSYLQVNVTVNFVDIDLGLFNVEEAEELRETLSRALDEVNDFILNGDNR